MNLASVSDDAIIVRSTIELAHKLGLRVIAEGVEDANAARILVEYDCDEVQGYHYARPAAAEDLWGLLTNWDGIATAGRA
jgi:EAL domain-containing protein (putative c-di-GMP-specific phosphodiesterase class I)